MAEVAYFGPIFDENMLSLKEILAQVLAKKSDKTVPQYSVFKNKTNNTLFKHIFFRKIDKSFSKNTEKGPKLTQMSQIFTKLFISEKKQFSKKSF